LLQRVCRTLWQMSAHRCVAAVTAAAAAPGPPLQQHRPQGVVVNNTGAAIINAMPAKLKHATGRSREQTHN
jgi:hypothetical protein